jgi:large subunit ribosomal protein L4
MKVKVYNLEGQVTEELDLVDAVFNVKVKPAVVHEVYVAQMNNQREPWADTKNRGEVSGGGKKPWRQKGTGRARHGSIRSPIWKGGGVAFGPLSVRNYKTKINKKTKQAALRMCLSDKLKHQALVVVEHLNFSEPKTKILLTFLKKLSIEFKSALILTEKNNLLVRRMAQNVPKLTTGIAPQVNVMDLVNKQLVVVTKEGIEKLETILNKA